MPAGKLPHRWQFQHFAALYPCFTHVLPAHQCGLTSMVLGPPGDQGYLGAIRISYSLVATLDWRIPFGHGSLGLSIKNFDTCKKLAMSTTKRLFDQTAKKAQ